MPVVGITNYNDLKISMSSLVRFAVSAVFLNEMYLCMNNAFAMARTYVFLSWPLNNVKLNNFFSGRRCLSTCTSLMLFLLSIARTTTSQLVCVIPAGNNVKVEYCLKTLMSVYRAQI